jgi:peptidoglycan/LPS O-acetylase OafA/YrhL
VACLFRPTAVGASYGSAHRTRVHCRLGVFVPSLVPAARHAPVVRGKRNVVSRSHSFHIPSLDGLRAVSFLIVFAAHAGLDQLVPGGFGVTVFFFLSGYLITTLMRVESDASGNVSLKKFYMRRALRILPPFYIVLLAATLLASVGFLGGDPLRPKPVLSQIFHISNYWIAKHGWSGIAPGTGVYWSLAVEEHFYLLFPALFLVLRRLHLTGRQMALCFWTSCALVLSWRCALVFFLHASIDRTYLCSDTRIDSIAFGCALAVWHNPMLDVVEASQSRSAFSRHAPWSIGLCILLLTFVVRNPHFRETFRYTAQGIALTPIFVAAVRCPHWPLFRPLNWQPVRFVGTISYSLYLVHQTTLMAVAQHLSLGGLARGSLALLISVAIAWVMYRVVEKPCAALRRRLSVA